MHFHHLSHFTDNGDGLLIDMREVKSEKEILPRLGVRSWLELQNKKSKIVVTHWERLQRMSKAVAEALVYLATNCDLQLITSSRYAWVSFNIYSPTLIQIENAELIEFDDPCMEVVRSMFKGHLDKAQMRTAFEQLWGVYDYDAKDRMLAFKKFQPHAAQYLSNLGTFPLSLCTLMREERFMLYAAFIGTVNASKHDSLIFASLNMRKRRVVRKKTTSMAVKEGRRWVGEERLLAIFHFIVPTPPSCLWLAKRIVSGLVEKRLLATQGGRKVKCLLGEHFLCATAQKLDNFELFRYLYKP